MLGDSLSQDILPYVTQSVDGQHASITTVRTGYAAGPLLHILSPSSTWECRCTHHAEMLQTTGRDGAKSLQAEAGVAAYLQHSLVSAGLILPFPQEVLIPSSCKTAV